GRDWYGDDFCPSRLKIPLISEATLAELLCDWGFELYCAAGRRKTVSATGRSGIVAYSARATDETRSSTHDHMLASGTAKQLVGLNSQSFIGATTQLGCRGHLHLKDQCPCATKVRRRRFAQAALKSCGSLE